MEHPDYIHDFYFAFINFSHQDMARQQRAAHEQLEREAGRTLTKI